jgi:pyruvate carboxylase subunit A
MTWETALNRAQQVLHDIGIYGIKSTIPYYRKILASPDFRRGAFNTAFVDTHPESLNYSADTREPELAAVVAAAIAAHMGV